LALSGLKQFFLPVAPFVDGLFEAMSGITTTGLSVMPVESLPGTLLFFRSYSQWIGGAGIVIVSLQSGRYLTTHFLAKCQLKSVFEQIRLVEKIRD